MLRIVPVLLFLLTVAAAAERREPASTSELAGITKRGRLLAEYDDAAWRATDAILALKPEPGAVSRYLAKKTETGWTVVFGRLNQGRDRFLIAYAASEADNSKQFSVKKYDPVTEDADFFLRAALAVESALASFKGPNRPYNVAVIPNESGLYVYVVPAQTKSGVFPLGGDARYLISANGSRVIDKRELHVSIIEFPSDPKIKVVSGYHTAVLDDAPEDTDVFHVLTRRPIVPEWVMTRKYVYQIAVDGGIRYLMTSDAFRRLQLK